MRYFFSFFKDHRWIFFLLLCCSLEFLVVFFLYDLPLPPVLYAALLSFLTLFIGAVITMYHRRKKLRLLEQEAAQKHRIPLTLPHPDSEAERLYHSLIETLEHEISVQHQSAKLEAAKTASYYTLWSHQIKTPIAAMRLLFQDAPLKKSALELELLKIEQYVDMALQYQRLDDGSRDLRIASYQVEHMVKQVIKKLAPLFIYKKLHLDLHDLTCSVITDEKWTCFLIEQILTNAIKYTPEGGAVSVFLDPDKPCCLIIRDTGLGILPEDLPRIFEWGYTGYNGRIKKHSTGIGLALCMQVTKLLGHTLSITSEVQKGTVVSIDLSNYPLEME